MTEPTGIPSPFEIAKAFVTNRSYTPETRHLKEHLLRTADWIKRLSLSPDETLLTAAVLHDIERVLRNPDPSRFRDKMKTFLDARYLAWHQKRSADIAADLLCEKNIDEGIIKRVYDLIRHHEVGGDEDQNLLKDADSLSFFETSVDHFLEVWVPVAGKEKVKEKFDWMFERITSREAKRIGKPFHEFALERLETVELT